MASGGMFRKQGAAALMKDGHSHFAGVEEAVELLLHHLVGAGQVVLVGQPDRQRLVVSR